MSVHYTTSVLELDRELVHQGQEGPQQGETETEVQILATYSLLRLLPGHMLPKSRRIAWHRYHISLPRPRALPRKLRINGGWFLGADRTVLSAGVLATLQLPTLVTHERLGSVGGMVPSVLVDTQVCFVQEAGGPITIRGKYAAVTAPDALDMSVLGRDVTGPLP
jgi:hypothetical protein